MTAERVGAALIAEGGRGATGGPPGIFEAVGRDALIALLAIGLEPSSRLLDFGCGWLRLGYWLVRFLDPERYRAIEPEADRVETGCRLALTPELIEFKRPRFDHNSDCDMGVFGERFDFVVAHSVLTHMAPGMLRTALASFRDNSTPEGLFLASYWRADGPHAFTRGTLCDELDDDDGSWLWLARYSFSEIERAAADVGLEVDELRRRPINEQLWLRFRHSGGDGG